LQQGQIKGAFDVAPRSGIPVPLPGAAKIPRFLDDAKIVDPHLLQPNGGQHPSKAAADDHHSKFLVQCVVREAWVDVEVFELRGDLRA
jgi:hypothetical protein